MQEVQVPVSSTTQPPVRLVLKSVERCRKQKGFVAPRHIFQVLKKYMPEADDLVADVKVFLEGNDLSDQEMKQKVTKLLGSLSDHLAEHTDETNKDNHDGILDLTKLFISMHCSLQMSGENVEKLMEEIMRLRNKVRDLESQLAGTTREIEPIPDIDLSFCIDGVKSFVLPPSKQRALRDKISAWSAEGKLDGPNRVKICTINKNNVYARKGATNVEIKSKKVM